MTTNYNKNAFASNGERRYSNWEGTVLSYTFDFVKNIETKVDLESVNHILDIGSRDACQSSRVVGLVSQFHDTLF